MLVLLIVGAFTIGRPLVYVFVILTALFSLIAFALLGYAAIQVVGLVKDVRADLKTLVGTAQDTLAEVQGTARFINNVVVSPVTQVAGFVSSARATVKAFTEPLYKRRS